MSALKGLRVLDLSRVLAGPYCTQMLGDMGAEVIKIEKPDSGDDTRSWGPPFLKDENGAETNESAYYLSCNRNKKSVAVDIKSDAGQKIIYRLLAHSDVLIENFKVGGLAKYGLSYDDLKDRYPKLIYCSITGYGQNGPLSSEPGYDFVAQGMSGLMASTGEVDGAPIKAGVALSDIMTGMNAAIAILAALRARDQSGKGQHVDLSLFNTTLSAMSNLAQYYLTSGSLPPRVGNAHATIVPYQSFQTTDGHVIIAVGNNSQFASLGRVLDKAEWIEDVRFKTNKVRVQNRTVLVPMIADIIKTKNTDTWLSDFRTADVPCGSVNTLDQVFDDPQVKAQDMRIDMDHPVSKAPISLVGSPLKMSGTPVSYDLSPPTLGQHTKEVLENLLGYSAEEIEYLKDNGAIEIQNLP